jgi:hypothetical protein
VLAATHAGGEPAGCQAVGAEIPPAQADCGGGAHLDDFGGGPGLGGLAADPGQGRWLIGARLPGQLDPAEHRPDLIPAAAC